MATFPFPFRSAPGAGQLFLSSSDNSPAPARFTHLSGTYPLKLLAPTPLPSQPSNLRVCYILAYGGGLVAGDTISLQVGIGAGSRLILLTQGSTKVFKNRMGIRPLAHGSAEATSDGQLAPPVTKQRLLVSLAPGSLLLLLPDPIQPFKSSSYIQSQRFVLPPMADDVEPASVLVLDWFTSGRNAGHKFQEEWEFELYSSMNEVIYASRVDGRECDADRQRVEKRSCDTHGVGYAVSPSTMPIMREKVTLRPSEDSTPTTTEPPHSSVNGQPPINSLQSRMRPYQIYATLLIHGPLLQPLLASLSSRANSPAETQFQASKPASLIWSFSKIPKTAQPGLGQGAVAAASSGTGEKYDGGILRVAGMETEVVKQWVEEVLVQGSVKELVGDALWQRIF
ncbi:hypothetical protein NCC49_005454 [Naganishia albida]|nr:hypothetical protein NCC49_005454 [Naganishia albida]